MAEETTLPTAEENFSDQIRIRRQKLAEMKEAGKDPFEILTESWTLMHIPTTAAMHPAPECHVAQAVIHEMPWAR